MYNSMTLMKEKRKRYEREIYRRCKCRPSMKRYQLTLVAFIKENNEANAVEGSASCHHCLHTQPINKSNGAEAEAREMWLFRGNKEMSR